MAKMIVRLGVDFGVIAIVGIVVLLINLFASPFLRGFYCNDESIKYPHKSSTVSTLAVALGSLFIPIALFAIIECTSKRGCASSSVPICSVKKLPSGVARWLKLSGVFLFGSGVAQIIVDVAKFMIGRLRPHFIAVCNPDVPCTSDLYFYNTNYNCLGSDTAAIEEARLSFPSGHASISFYGAVFTILYLQCVFKCSVSKLLRHVLQFIFLIAAWFTALSRITDYHHHWSDVLAGIAIGSLIAVLNVIFVTDLRHQYSRLRKEEEDLSLSLMECDTNRNNVANTSTSYERGDQNSVF